MNVGERPATGTLLLHAGVAGRLGEHATLANKDDMAVRELLLQFTGKARYKVSISCSPRRGGEGPRKKDKLTPLSRGAVLDPNVL